MGFLRPPCCHYTIAPVRRRMCVFTKGRSSDLLVTRVRLLEMSSMAVCTRAMSHGGLRTHSSGNCCRISRHSLLISRTGRTNCTANVRKKINTTNECCVYFCFVSCYSSGVMSSSVICLGAEITALCVVVSNLKGPTCMPFFRSPVLGVFTCSMVALL